MGYQSHLTNYSLENWDWSRIRWSEIASENLYNYDSQQETQIFYY